MPLDERIKNARGRRALMRLLRKVLAVVCVAVLLQQQPFMVKPRKAKLVPLHLVLGGGSDWASSLESPMLQDAISITSRSLLTPLEYLNMPNSKRTLGAAYEKTARKLDRIIDGNSTAQKFAQRPYPNVPLIGSYLLTVGSGLAVLIPGAEFAILAGCGCLLFGCSGMASQPELFFVALLAALGLAALKSSQAENPKPKLKRKSKKAKAQMPCEDKCGTGCGEGNCH